jgi:acetyl esterase/lipase
LTGHVEALPSGEWQSTGELFADFTARMKQLGPRGFRAVLWHQGESDANQKDASRTLPGKLYQKFLEQLIRDSRREVGWEFPWFVAQASYHSPDDPCSADIRAAQQALWKSGVALEGPDSDALVGDLRDSGGQGVHFSGQGLREHAARWVEKVGPWLDRQLASAAIAPATSKPVTAGPPPKLVLPGENFTVEGRPAFVFLPPEPKRAKPQPWIFYAPTLPAYPDEAERWMHERFLAAGIAVAGVDAGEAYGSPKSHALFEALYRELTVKRGFASKPCLFGRSRGGLWVSSWAIANPSRVAGIIGIYPVFDFRTYPGLTNAAPAYGLTPAELEAQAAELNPISRVGVLARALVPAALIHGDVDRVVPLKENSAEFVRRYKEADAESLVKLFVLEGQGHNFFEGFFHSQELVDFAIARARAGAHP